MAIGKKKMLFCESCDKDTWATLQMRYLFKCNVCDGEIDLLAAKKKARAERKAARKHKAKILGTFESDAAKKERKRIQHNGERDTEFIGWVKHQRCCVPYCRFSGVVDAHHAVHKSQGGTNRDAVPLCHEHHIGVYHGECGSVEAFKETTGVDLREESRRLQLRYEIILDVKKKSG